MKLCSQGQFDTLKRLDVGINCKMPPVLFLDWGTRFQSSKRVVLITSLQIVVLT